MVEYLQQVCIDKHNPPYYIKEIESTSLEIGRADAHLKKFPTIDGSTLFQVMLFKPHLTYFKAAPHLCLCSECLEDYGSCHRFVEYELVVHELNKVSLRLEKLVFEGESEAIEDFLLPKSYCAVSADQKAKDTIWFIKITNISSVIDSISDDYGNKIAPGQQYLEGHFMEETVSSLKGYTYKLNEKKKTFFFKETVVYPFVQFEETKKGHFITMQQFTDIINYVEYNGL